MKQSAGLLLYRKGSQGVEVLLVHPGGPFWARKDAGAWSIPKGELAEGEEGLVAAQREFHEELGIATPEGDFQQLEPVKQSNKVVHAWALEADLDVDTIVSNTVELEWPPRSGQHIAVPEVDRAKWFPLAKAQSKLVKGQVGLIEQLAQLLGVQVDQTGGVASNNQVQISLF